MPGWMPVCAATLIVVALVVLAAAIFSGKSSPADVDKIGNR
jgi:hypothetical protein